MDLFGLILGAMAEAAREAHNLHQEPDGTLLSKDTMIVVGALEEENRQRLIDQALREKNRDAFMKLTGSYQ